MGDIKDQMVQKQLDQLNTSKIEAYWHKLNNDYRGFLPEIEGKGLLQLIFSSDDSFQFTQLFWGFFQFIFHEVLVNGKLLGTIILLTIFTMILEHIQSSFENSSVSKVAFAIAYLVLIVLAINSFYVAMDFAKDAIRSMMDFMLALIPILLSLLAAIGSFSSVALFHPLIIFMVNTSSLLVYYVVFPLFFFATLLKLVSSISERYQLTRLAALLNQIGIAVLGAFLTIFLGILSVQGAVTSISDGITLRTAKYVTGNFVPVVGKMFSDAAETIMGASLLLKNGVGLFGVIVILLFASFPALKILAIVFIYKVSAALLQPLGTSPIINTLSAVGNSLLLVFAALATVSMMFFLSITIIITAANLSIMIR